VVGVLRDVRPDERGLVVRAFAVLAALLFSHTVLETGRDAAFLTRASAERLPVVYIATALVALGWARRAAVVGTLAGLRNGALGAAAVVVGLAILLGAGLDVAVYALYVASGILTATLLVHLFSLLGSVLSITQAKRLFPVIGLGSISGALAGSAAAAELSRWLAPAGLLGVASGGFAAAGLLAGWLPTQGVAEHRPGQAGWLEPVRNLLETPYPRRVCAIVLASAAASTVADYLFKSVVADHVAPEQLGQFFGRAYLLLNGLSLLSQAGLVALILKRFDLIVGLSTLPALMLLSTTAAWIAGGVAAALLLKAPEGILKHSLHRTTMELLYVPLDARTRGRIKSWLDLLGQRLGQAGASAAILVTASVSEVWVWGLLLVLVAVWIGSCLNLRVHYLDLFRRRLRRGWGAFSRPRLTLEGLETMFTGLDSPDPHTVLAALRLLEEEDRPQVVPGLILYHPSSEVVVAALDLFARTERPRSPALIAHCFDHPAVEVREAAVGAWSRLNRDPLPDRVFRDEAPSVRVAAALAAGNPVDLAGMDRNLQSAVARTAGRTGRAPGLLARLSSDPDPLVRRAAVEAAHDAPSVELLDPLIRRLPEKRLRPSVLRALGRIEHAQAGLQRALDDDALPRLVRCEIPEALARVAERPEEASQVLLSSFVAATDGMVRYRMLLALERLCAEFEDLEPDPKQLDQAIHAVVSRAYRYLDRALCLEKGARDRPELRTEGHGLISDTLTAKRVNAVERLVRLLVLRYPRAGLDAVKRALRTGDKEDRAAAIELLEGALSGSLKLAVGALVDGRSDGDALRQSGRFHEPLGLDYPGLLQHMLEGGSVTMEDLVAFHLAELDWTSFLPQLEALAARRPDGEELSRAITLLRARAHA